MEEQNGAKRIFCYCHFGGDSAENNQNQSMWSKDKRTFGMMATSTTTFEEFIAQLQRKLGLAGSHLKLKYVLEYDKSSMVDLMDEEDLHNMVNFSEKFAHVYVTSTEKSSSNIHHEEKRSEEKSASKCSSMNIDDGEEEEEERVLDPNVVCPSSEGHVFLDKTDSAASFIGTEQHGLNYELWKNAIIGSGHTFNDALAFRNALYRYSLAHKFNYKFLKNSTHIMRVRCLVEECEWQVNAVQVGETASMRVTTFIEEHSHSAQDINDAKSKLKPKLAANIISSKIKMQPEITPNEVKAILASELNMHVTYRQAWQVKAQAMRMIRGVSNATEDGESLSPPTAKRPPGRPKVKHLESESTKKRRVHCSLCNEVGHNRVKCKSQNPS